VSSSRLLRHAHIVWQSERVIAELRLKRLLGNLGLQALAALVLGFALLSFEIAAYFLLVQVWSASASAAILGLCNLVIALLLMAFAGRRPASRELALAKEVHQDALTAFSAELERAEAAAPASFLGALEGAALPLLLPLIPLLIKRLHRHHADRAAPEAE
jgi:hypothetical protein